ncbi:25745_t:CDS:2 [Dentiscutata erythropus]|uniref:25745_t:CDS:1 n=1 Tax=Dentiscutata erythropus TaxID=1348616 RepID=A0A9N9N8W7_9GLOM|nr:25745_t:CDS:2 [Dentiscutata erythropus]
MASSQAVEVLNKTSSEPIYTWSVKEFQDLYTRMGTGAFIMSERFASPQPFTIDPKTGAKDPIQWWRLVLYPHGYVNEPDHLAVFLTTSRSEYEKRNQVKSRTVQRFWFELFRVDNSDAKSKKPTLIASRSFKKSDFVFESQDDSHTLGTRKLVPFTEIFADGKDHNNVTLIIRVHIINEVPFTRDSLNERTKPFLTSFEKFFMDEKYCDTEFKFDCGSKIKSNRLFLASRSECFDSLFKEKELSLDELQNLYFDSVTMHLDNLKEMVIARIGGVVDIHTWDQILKFSLKINEEKLQNIVILFLQSNWDEVKQTIQMDRMLKDGQFDWIGVIENLVTKKILGN